MFQIMNKKGLSEIVITLIIVALTVVSVVVVWTFLNTLITKQIGNSESCFGNYNKVILDKKNVCYNNDGKVRFAISIGEVDVSGVLVSISDSTNSKTFKITNVEQEISGLTYLKTSVKRKWANISLSIF